MNELFFKTLTLMWQGMLGIFVVMSVIAIIVYLFSRFSKNPEKKD